MSGENEELKNLIVNTIAESQRQLATEASIHRLERPNHHDDAL